MIKGTPAAIALRYLRLRKNGGAVGAIALISVTGVAIATAAILCVLSVFNGFREVLSVRDDYLASDVEIKSRKGKVITDADNLADSLSSLPEVAVALPLVEDQALSIYNYQEMPVMLRGVDLTKFRRISSLDSIIVMGDPFPADPFDCDPPAGLISPGVARRLGIYNATAEGGDRLFLFAPRREGRINIANPASSFFTDSISVTSIFRTDRAEIDGATVYVPLELARGLFQYDTEATSILIKGAEGTDSSRLAGIIARRLGSGYDIKDRAMQQQLSFRMINIEKWITALLLFFILVIASFNIVSTMTMIVIEKKRSIASMRAMGMRASRIGRIFAWESLYITLAGASMGIILGVTLSLLQQHFGFIKMGGNTAEMIISDYPVKLIWHDIFPVMGAVLLTGLFTSLTAASFARSRISGKRR